MKRVLYVCSEAAMATSGSNVTNIVDKSEVLKAFVLVASPKKYSYVNNYYLAGNITFFEYSSNPVRRLIDKFYNYTLLNRIKKIVKEQQIDYIHFLTGDYALHAIIPQLRKTAKIVYTIHDLQPHESAIKIMSLKEKFFVKYIVWGVRQIIKQANILATCSKEQALQLEEKYPSKPVYFYQLPTSITNAVLQGNDACPELATIDKYILFFGNIQIYKGVELLYRAFLDNEIVYSNYYLVIAGAGKWYFERDKNEKKVIRINRYVADSEIGHLFRNASAVVYPYISATQSAVQTIAYQFGTPLLVSDIPYFRDNVEDKHSGIWFKSQDENDLADKLQELLFRTDREQMKKEQKDYYDKHYSDNAIRKQIERIYQ